MSVDIDKLIASIASSLVRAKAIVDVHTLEVAELYRKEELLKIFPIPTVNIDTVEVEMKVSIEALKEEPTENDVITNLKQEGVNIDQKVERRLREKIKAKIREKGLITAEELKVVLSEEKVPVRDPELIKSISKRAVSKINIKTGVTKEELREADEKSLVNIKLKISLDDIEDLTYD